MPFYSSTRKISFESSDEKSRNLDDFGAFALVQQEVCLQKIRVHLDVHPVGVALTSGCTEFSLPWFSSCS